MAGEIALKNFGIIQGEKKKYKGKKEEERLKVSTWNYKKIEIIIEIDRKKGTRQNKEKMEEKV